MGCYLVVSTLVVIVSGYTLKARRSLLHDAAGQRDCPLLVDVGGGELRGARGEEGVEAAEGPRRKHFDRLACGGGGWWW